MWLNSVSSLCIYKNRYVDILTRYGHEKSGELQEIQALKFALNHQDCEDFLISKAATLELLKLQGDGEKNQINVDHLQLKVKSFKHIKKLIFSQIIVTDDDLQVIGQNCPQLQSLQIIECFCEHFEVLIPGVNISIAEICKIKQLRELVLQTTDQPPPNERSLKLQLILTILDTLPQLKHLNLKNFTIKCTELEKTDKSYLPTRCWPLEILHMGRITFDFWCTFTGILKCCPHLRNLSIQATAARDIIINFKIIDILSIYCQNLQILKLENCEIEVKNFADLQTLQEITLSFCRGLSFNNLQEILGGLKLKVFKLFHTPITDTGNFIYISPTLESITVDSVHFREISEMFQRSLNNFANLKTLQWLSGDIDNKWIMEKCPQLQQLHILNSHQLWHIVHNMKSLRELTITSIAGLSWSLLNNLIFKLLLKHLNIPSNCVIIDENTYSSKSLMMARTTLEFLTISVKMFLVSVTYWLDLLNANKQLDLLICGNAEDILNVRLMCLLLATDCVRQRRNRLKICGLKLELENFQKSTILREIAYAQINTSHYKEKKLTFALQL